MQENTTCITNTLEGTNHKIPKLNFTIEHMDLIIEPFFDSKTIKCEQQLIITANENIHNIELDSSELEIKSVTFSKSQIILKPNKDISKIRFLNKIEDKKLVILFDFEIPANTTFYLKIEYTAQPRTGFHFIEPDKYYHNKTLHAWTQGEPEDTKYWLPCIDNPQIKFSRSVSIIATKDLLVISNGKKVESKEIELDTGKKTIHTWIEDFPDATYLTSIAIGNFVKVEDKNLKKNQNKMDLTYYVPKNKEEYAKISFQDTADMMKFFEDYLKTNYPYSKYAQVVVEDFDYDGMENTSCTIYYDDILANKNILNDPCEDYANRNSVIAHELAHQWFGDLVTCKDWSHIWLNEAFASFFEALYWENKTKSFDEYIYYLLKKARDYFDEACGSYVRPIVYSYYNDPIDLFDRHSYQKGACVLHMIRNYIGDRDFKSSLYNYLNKYKFKTVETNNLLETFSENTNKNIDEFSNQWVYNSGHPKISVLHYIDEKDIKIKIIQKQESKEEIDINNFKFPLDIKFNFSFNNTNKKKVEIHTVEVSQKESEGVFQIPIDETGEVGKLEWFSIDPEYKILKEIIYNDSPKEMLLKQLKEGDTAYERIQAIESFTNNGFCSCKFVNDDHIINALKNSVIKDRFYGVSIEAASALGMFTQSNQAYESIKECINIITDQKIKNQLINSLSQFEKEDKDMLNLFIRTLKDEKESYLVRSSTATAIGNITYKNKNIEEYITLLKETVKENNSIFKDRIAKGAISAIKKFANTNDEEMLSNIMDFLIWISDYKSRNTNRIRDTATATLGYFLIKRTKDKGTEINLNVFNHLEYLLKDDPWWKTRNNAIAAILVYFSGNGIIGLDKESIKKALDMLEYAIRTDVHAQVRENAQKAVEYINKSQIDPTKIEKVKRHIIKSITQRRLLYK